MEIDTSIILSFVAIVIAIATAIFSWKRASIASKSLHQMSLQNLFSSFNQAGQACLENPDFLYAVGGLDKSISHNEAKNIAYLSLLIDGFQQYYGQKYKENFSKMVKELKNKSTYLNQLLANKSNQKRWEIIKPLYYGNFDSSFIEAIDELTRYDKQ